MKTATLFTSEVIIASAFARSEVIDLDAYVKDGFFSIQLILTGDGTAKVEYEVSNTGFDYVTQSDAEDIIVSGFTKTSGPGSDGKDLISFDVEPSSKMKIKITETGGADSITISAAVLVV